jgi:phospholipase/carboxylesterase/glyoxalase family protein
VTKGLRLVHRYLPPERPDLPTLLLLHGTGGDENDLLPLGRMLLPGAGILSPRGAVIEHGMPRFFRRLSPGVFDLDDLRQRTHELADFITAAAETYAFDPAAVIAVGYSNGANIAASLLLQRPGALSGAVLFHAQVPYEPREAPNIAGVPVFLSGGRMDPMVPAAETERLGTLLRAAGAELTVYWEPGGHALGRGEVEAAAEWLQLRLSA